MMAHVLNLHCVVRPEEGNTASVTGVGLGDAMRCGCHGGALHNLVVVMLNHKSVRVMLVFVVDLQCNQGL